MSNRGSRSAVVAVIRRVAGVAALALCLAPQAGAANRTAPAPAPVTPVPSAPATSVPATRATPIPDVLRVMPETAAAGETTVLLLAVKNFSADRCSLDFGGGTTILQPVQMTGVDNAQLSLQVAAASPLGRHDIWVTCEGVPRKKATSFLTLTAGTAQRVELPDVLAVTPANLKRGAAYTLTLQVVSFNAPSHAVTKLDFGPGIQGTRVMDTQPPLWKVEVGLGAPTGRHAITISYLWKSDNGTRTRVATAAVYVEGDAPASPVPPPSAGDEKIKDLSPAAPIPVAPPPIGWLQTPDVFAVSPNSWRAGASHELTLSGRSFAAGMQLRFGEGVTVKGEAKVVSPTLAYLTVAVAGDAAAGVRQVEIAPAKGQAFTKATATARVSGSLASARRRTKDVMPAYDNAADVKFTPSAIVLIAPGPWDEGTASGAVFNDETTFRWQEENPGISEEFELRIVYLSEKGTPSPLVTARIKPQQGAGLPPTYYSPDAALWDKLLTGTFDLVEDSSTDFQGAPDTYTYSGKLGTRIIYWQVTGYRVFSKVTFTPPLTEGAAGKKTVSKSQMLVAQSELRPLKHPSQPLGLSCFSTPNSQTPEGNRDAHDLKYTNLEAGSAGNYYTNDRIQITGSIRLADLPYAMHAEAGPEPDGGESTDFSNIFVDWGDGTGAETLSTYLPPPPENPGYQPPVSDVTPAEQTLHRYKKTGTHVVRVFMLSGADAWYGDPSALVPAVEQAPPGSPTPWYDAPAQFGGGSVADVARRAYLIYCASITIVPRKDLVSEGPLLLESLTITAFNDEPGKGGKARLKTDAERLAEGPVALQPRTDLAPGNAGGPHVVDLSPEGTSPPPAGPAPGMQSLKKDEFAGPQGVSAGTLAGPYQADPKFSECDSLQAHAELVYYGCGTARVEWRLVSLASGESVVVDTEDLPVGRSPARTDLGPSSATPLYQSAQTLFGAAVAGTPPIPGVKHIFSPVVPLSKEQAGKRFALRASALVISHCTDEAAVAASSKPKGLSAGSAASAEQAAHKKPADGDVGVLSPYREGRSKQTGVGYGAAPGAFSLDGSSFTLLEKPFFVASEPSGFMVVASDPKLPCRFSYQTADGVFPVDTLRDLQPAGGGRWSGRGSLHLPFAVSPGKQELLVATAFTGWLAADGQLVTDGALDVAAPVAGELDAHGMRVVLHRLSGAAGAAGRLDLALTARLPDGRLPGNPATWKASEKITPAGDWIAAAGPLAIAPLGYSSHTLESPAVVLDLSEAANLKEPAAACGSGPAWMGFHFGDARIHPNTFGLFAGLSYAAPGWTALAPGLCGSTTMTFAGGPAAFKAGVLGWDAIVAVADGKGNIKSTYQNFTATVPQPIDATFTGPVVLHDQAGKEPWPDFSAVKGPSTRERSYATAGNGRIDLAMAHFGLDTFADAGWGIRADLTLTFLAEGKVFAGQLPALAVVEGFDGRIYRAGGDQSPVTVPLGMGTTLGQNVTAVLDQLKISGFGGESLDFGFAVKVRISEKLGETPMPVGYGLKQQQGAVWAGRGPIASPFVQEIVYNGGGQGGVATKVQLSFMQGDNAGGGAHETSIGNCASTDFFCGYTDDMAFMGASVKADFRLGYKEGDSYFALRAEVAGLNVPIPPCFALYGVRGGLGYNFKLTDFLQHSLLDVEPDMGGDYVFMAGLAAGLASDPSLLSFDATLLISTGEQPMMTFKAWVLSPDRSGQGDVWGFFTAGAGGFDGAMAGDKSFFGDILRVEMPGDIGCYARPSVKEVVSCAQASWASVAHFGGLTDWYVYIGRPEGPRVSATLVSLFKPSAYVTLRGIGGLAFGADFDLTKEIPAGSFRAGFSIGAHFAGRVMWPDPLGVAADAAGWAKIYACYKSLCVDPGVDIWASMEFSTAKIALSAGFSVGMPCPVDSVSFGLRVLPCCGLSADIDWCDYGIF